MHSVTGGKSLSRDGSSERDAGHSFYVKGKRVDKEEWIKYLRDSRQKLDAELQKLGVAGEVDTFRNEWLHNVSTSGITTTFVGTDPTSWFKTWAEEELPDLFAQGQLTTFEIIKNQEDRWSARLRRYAGGLISGLILAILSILIAWAMGLIGFK